MMRYLSRADFVFIFTRILLPTPRFLSNIPQKLFLPQAHSSPPGAVMNIFHVIYSSQVLRHFLYLDKVFVILCIFLTKPLDKTGSVLYIIDTKNKGVDSSEELEHGSSARETVGSFESLMCVILHHLFSAQLVLCVHPGKAG